LPESSVAHSMRERGPEVADVFSNSFEKVKAEYVTSPRTLTVASHIMDCRTAKMGAFVYECESCGSKLISYCSCRDRMCPKCQSEAHNEWIEKMEKVVLDCVHLHVVITVPACLNPIALANKELFYNVLFEVASMAVLILCRQEKNLGAVPGITAILHTWGQQLSFHPHVHLAVTAGGLTDDGRWVDAKRTTKGDIYLFPVKALAKIVKMLFLKKLRRLKKKELLKFDDDGFRKIMRKADDRKWISYCKEPFKGSRGVFAYIGNYTHRSAISNSRILSVTADEVTFRYRDYRDHMQKKLTLKNEEFIRRFLMHVLKRGFVRIRHYGLYAVPNRKTKLAEAREKLAEARHQATPVMKNEEVKKEVFFYRCPCCGGNMYRTTTSPYSGDALSRVEASLTPLPP
jgi:hypothetical protein